MHQARPHAARAGTTDLGGKRGWSLRQRGNDQWSPTIFNHVNTLNLPGDMATFIHRDDHRAPTPSVHTCRQSTRLTLTATSDEVFVMASKT